MPHRFSVALALVLGAGAFSSLMPAVAETVEDERQEIVLTAEERAFVLKEMRGFLNSVEGVISAVANDKAADAEAAAKASGMSVMHEVPQSLRKKLPMAFMKMGHMTHQNFDKLAQEAASLGDKAVILKQLDTILNTCNTCHAQFRLSQSREQ